MRVAIVGSGIAGLAAAWRLNGLCDVTLFEAAPHVGGHTRTIPLLLDGRRVAVDIGFIVFNHRTYPGLTALFTELGVRTRPSDMSFSVRSESTGFEYNASTVPQLLARRRNLLRPTFYRMLAGILRFHRRAPALLDHPGEPTLGEFLRSERLPGPFVDLYLVPMLAAIWSGDPQRMLEMPARTLVRFLHNHGLLTVDDRPQWRVVEGGSRRYVDAFLTRFRGVVRPGTPVRAVRRGPEGVTLDLDEGGERFDRVVLATHSDQALRLLSRPTPSELEVLGTIPYQENDVALHTDTSFLPRTPTLRASWNYHLDPVDADGKVKVTYWMNRLQGLSVRQDLLVTLNRTERIAPGTLLHRETMAHPIFTREGARAQTRWAEISGADRIHFAGAYWGHGFHEDGLQSGYRAAGQILGADARGPATRQEDVAEVAACR